MYSSGALLSAGPLTVGAQGRASLPKACGVERWRVKILADETRDRVSWQPETISVSTLRRIPAPAWYPATRRIAPYELKLYRVRAVVRQIFPESDGDWHIVLADPDRVHETLVAEIPDSSCALGSGHESDYAAARRALRSIPRYGLIELDGVGFFDYLHGQRGMSPNGFELHPVVALRSLDSTWDEGTEEYRPSADSGGLRQRTDSGAQSDADAQVWLNTNSRIYHCSDSRYYGRTKHGQFMRESEAIARGARPAYRRPCSS